MLLSFIVSDYVPGIVLIVSDAVNPIPKDSGFFIGRDTGNESNDRVDNPLGVWILNRRKSIKFKTRKQFADASGVAATVLWELEHGKGLPFHERTTSTRRAIAATLDVDVDALDLFSRGVTGPPDEPSPSGVSSIGLVQPVKWIPVYHGVSACRRDHREGVQVGELPIPDHRAEFAVRIDGECMLPEYPPGCSAVFSKAEADANGLVSGKDYLIWFNDGQATFKRVLRTPHNFRLRCLNPDKGKFPDRLIPESEIACAALCLSVSIAKA